MLILLTGGSACGKSTYAEKLAEQFAPPRYYVATMRVYDAEGRQKVARHQKIRQGKGFITIEQDVDIQQLEFMPQSTVLLECMCNLTANEMFSREGRLLDAYAKIRQGIAVLASRCTNLLVVTNDVGSDGADYEAATQAYIRTLGRLNQDLARDFDHVYELVCGIPLVWKGELL